MAVVEGREISDYPWLAQHWEQLTSAYQHGYLAHAYLFHTQQNLGVANWLQDLATYFLCSQPMSSRACGQCQNCNLRRSGSHPDCYLIGDDNAAMIKVDTIRWVQEQVYQTQQIGHYKIFIIPQADRLNQAASNALLKILEEPPEQTLFFLETQAIHGLLPTIISRCQVIPCLSPDETTLQYWVKKQGHDRDDVDWTLLCRLARYSPWTLQNLLQSDYLQQRQQWIKTFYQFSCRQITLVDAMTTLTEKRLDEYLQVVYFWTQDMIKLQTGASSMSLINYDLIQYLQDLASRVATEDLLNFVNLLQNYWQYQQLSYNINPRLALENILLVWQSIIQH